MPRRVEEMTASLAAAGDLRIILLHGGFAGGEFVLDLAALVAAGAGELLVGVVEFVAVELDLGLGCCRGRRSRRWCRWVA